MSVLFHFQLRSSIRPSCLSAIFRRSDSKSHSVGRSVGRQLVFRPTRSDLVNYPSVLNGTRAFMCPSQVYVGVGEHESVSSSDFLSVRREIYGKLKTVTKYSKIKSHVQSENVAASDQMTKSTNSSTGAENKTSKSNNGHNNANLQQPQHLPKSPRPTRASLLQQQQHQTARHVPSTTDYSSSSSKNQHHHRAPPARGGASRYYPAETEDEVSSSCEKHTGKDSGIEDEDTPRESEQGSKISLLDRTSGDHDEPPEEPPIERTAGRKLQGKIQYW